MKISITHPVRWPYKHTQNIETAKFQCLHKNMKAPDLVLMPLLQQRRSEALKRRIIRGQPILKKINPSLPKYFYSFSLSPPTNHYHVTPGLITVVIARIKHNTGF